MTNIQTHPLAPKRLVFIHSLFRTGSTYIWNKFREKPEFCCYYEPFHQVLIKVTAANLEYSLTKDFDAVHHPQLDRCYLDEYRNVLNKDSPGVAFFKKSFSFDLFCLKENQRSHGQKRYIDNLVQAAGNRIPLFKFNRTAMRTSWFKQEYPESLNIYLLRNPRDQWHSYFKISQRTGYNSFFVMDLLAVSINKRQACFGPLIGELPLIEYHSDSYDREELFYKILLEAYTDEEKYLIFYYLWLITFFHNILHADFILNINLLSKSPSYKEATQRHFLKLGLADITFQDADLGEYSAHPLPQETLSSIERKVQELVIQSSSQEQIGQLFQKLSLEDGNYFHFHKEDFLQIREHYGRTYHDVKKRSLEKMEKMLQLSQAFFAEAQNGQDLQRLFQQTSLALWQSEKQIKALSNMLVKKEHILETLHAQLKAKANEIDQKNSAIRQKDEQLSGLANQVCQISAELKKVKRSRTFRTGRVVLWPLRTGKNAYIRLKRWQGRSALYQATARPVLTRLSKYERKVDLTGQLEANFGRHRSGLKYGLRHLTKLHNPRGVLFDTFVERTFFWKAPGVKTPERPWIGIVHVPPQLPEWFLSEQSNDRLFESQEWQKSLPYCRGLFTLSNYHRAHLKKRLAVPVVSLFLPSETPRLKWSWDKFMANKQKKIVQVGWWLRKLHAIYQLPQTDYKKIFLSVEHEALPALMQKEKEILMGQGAFREEMYSTAGYVSYLPDKDYDDLLSQNIVFLSLYDTSANNAIIECLVRNTPVLVNPLEAVIEYLGEDYPFYFNSLEEAASKVMDNELIYKTHRFLVSHPTKRKLTGQYFLKSLATSSIYYQLELTT